MSFLDGYKPVKAQNTIYGNKILGLAGSKGTYIATQVRGILEKLAQVADFIDYKHNIRPTAYSYLQPGNYLVDIDTYLFIDLKLAKNEYFRRQMLHSGVKLTTDIDYYQVVLLKALMASGAVKPYVLNTKLKMSTVEGAIDVTTPTLRRKGQSLENYMSDENRKAYVAQVYASYNCGNWQGTSVVGPAQQKLTKLARPISQIVAQLKNLAWATKFNRISSLTRIINKNKVRQGFNVLTQLPVKPQPVITVQNILKKRLTPIKERPDPHISVISKAACTLRLKQLNARCYKKPSLKIFIPFEPLRELNTINEVLNTENDFCLGDYCGLFTLLPYLPDQKRLRSKRILSMAKDDKFSSSLFENAFLKLGHLLLSTDTGWANKCRQCYNTPYLDELLEVHRKFGHDPNLVFKTKDGLRTRTTGDPVTLLIYDHHIELWCGQPILDSPVQADAMRYYESVFL
jgi:hypothetical protein